MVMTVPAVFENGVLRPLLPLELSDGQQVQVVVDVSGSLPSDSLELLQDCRKAEELSPEELDAFFDELSAGPDLPILPDSAYTREGIYEGG
jgi:predicted DNA-binding antitoxin AbrB/MazE fold protein